MTSKEIRKAFLDFFASKGHQIVPSAPMVVKNDPTLMFTNAGMNQFKDWFLGNSPAKWKRVADSQKCLRVSGKHNDLEEVGRDTYHHTMFEMLGNWSFGDYFKDEAIDWAWELLTEVYKLDKDRLYATVFEGSEADGTKLDTEAMEAWKRHLPEDRILLGNKKDNFWEMGDTGPCGPCSEIHIDLRSDEERAAVPGASLVNKDHHLVIEIWNNVFMQYNRKANGELELLPNKNVDTGMGFERLCMALQGKQSNYDTDVFTGMISKIEELSGHKYGNTTEEDIAMRVIADHIRALLFCQLDNEEERDGDHKDRCNENYISFFHLEVEREKRESDHSCGEKRNGKSAEGSGNSPFVNGLVLELSKYAHSDHKAKTYTKRGDKGLDVGKVMLNVVDAKAEDGAVDREFNEIRVAVSVKKLLCDDVKDLNNDEDHKNEYHCLQVGDLLEEIGVERPADGIGDEHYKGSAEAEDDGLLGGALVFHNGTCAEEVEKSIVVGKKTSKKNTEDHFDGKHYSQSSSSRCSCAPVSFLIAARTQARTRYAPNAPASALTL